MGIDKRKFERYPARLEVEIRTRGRGQICPSLDVSRHGMFLTTPNPPHERQLLILRIPVPDDQPPIDVMASVVRRHSPGAGGNAMPAGMGINFFALTEENKNRWEAFLAKLRGEVPRAPEVATEGSRPTFLLQPRDIGRLQLFEARDFAQGSMFLRTPVLREVGEIIKVMLLHPVTDEEFPLLAKVQSIHSGSKTEPKGMTLEFAPVDADLRRDFHAFVEHGVTSQAAILSAASMPNGKEVRPLFSPREGDGAEGASGTAQPEDVPEADAILLVTEEEISSDRMQDLLSDLKIEPPEPPPASQPSRPPLPSPVPSASPPVAPASPPAGGSGSSSAGTQESAGGQAGRGERRTETSVVMPAPSPPSIAASVAPSTPSLAPAPAPENPRVFEELRTALGMAPEDVSLLFRLGSGMARQPTTAFEAIGYLQRLLALEPHHPLANGVLALAYAQIGQRAAAERHLSRARRLGQPVDARVQALLSSTSA